MDICYFPNDLHSEIVNVSVFVLLFLWDQIWENMITKKNEKVSVLARAS